MIGSRRQGAAAVPALLLALSLAGCSGLRPVPRPPTAEEILAARGVDPDEVTLPQRLTPEMRGWLAEHAPEGSAEQRLEALLHALAAPLGEPLVYAAEPTGTAAQVWESGRFNCLSFTHLFVAMARELGLPAFYVRVEDEADFHREGDLVMVTGHVTAAYGEGDARLVLEFPALPGGAVGDRRVRRIPDLTAIGMFYANRGAELLRAGEVGEAIRRLETGLRVAPDDPDLWNNLGVARRRGNDFAAAERAYRRAVELDPSTHSAWHNLAALYRLRGEVDAARRILRLLERTDARDPFIYLALGDDRLRLDELDAARRFYRRALRLDPDLPEVRAAMGEWALAAGRPEAARRWLERSRRAGEAGLRGDRLAAALGGAASGEPAPGDPNPKSGGG